MRQPVINDECGVNVAFGVVGLFDTVLFELVEHGLGRQPAFFGVLMSLQGAGSIVGGLTAARMLRWLGPARAVGVAGGRLPRSCARPARHSDLDRP